jgi:pyruvate/2-oxoglutarate dehydrogenase complex dihydrolipoamide acyltransferase (E2) component
MFTKLVAGLIGLSVVMSIVVSIISSNEQKRKDEEKAALEQARLAAIPPKERAALEKKRVAEAAKAAALAAAENKTRDTRLKMAGMGALTLKRAMRDPQSFDLTSLVAKPNGTACYEYRAVNGFGANLPSEAVLTSGGQLLTKDRDGNAFVSAWNKNCTVAGGDEIAALVKRLGVLD